ncbi:hypothetical protein BGZ76_002629, partial [Entomortierella beljakovae]
LVLQGLLSQRLEKLKYAALLPSKGGNMPTVCPQRLMYPVEWTMPELGWIIVTS